MKGVNDMNKNSKTFVRAEVNIKYDLGVWQHSHGGINKTVESAVELKKWQIWQAELPTTAMGSSVQSGLRPVLLYGNNMHIKSSPCIQVIPFTTRQKTRIPVHLSVSGFGLPQQSTLLPEQKMPLDKKYLKKYLGTVDSKIVREDIVNKIRLQNGD